MSYTVPVAHSGIMASFLHTRLDTTDADAAIAQKLLYAERAATDNEPDYYDLVTTPEGVRISYTTPQKYRRLGVNPWHEGGHRINAKPAKIAQKLTSIKDGRALDVFSNAASAFLSALPDVQLASGSDISDHYDEYNHCTCARLGDLKDSCMRYEYCQDRFGMYEDVAHLAVILCSECGDTQARALVWTDTDGKRWHDRIYGSSLNTHLMRRWFAEQGIAGVYGTNPGPVTVQLPHASYERAPYMDSLKHYCATCGTLSNQWLCAGHDQRYLSGYSEEGDGQDHEGWPGARCESCGNEFHREYCQECEDCGARYICDANCPNEQYCREHDRYYCAGYSGTRDCPESLRCGGCDLPYCGDACPDGCVECPHCGEWTDDRHGPCSAGCVECARCGVGSTRDERGEFDQCPRCEREVLVALSISQNQLALALTA